MSKSNAPQDRRHGRDRTNRAPPPSATERSKARPRTQRGTRRLGCPRPSSAPRRPHARRHRHLDGRSIRFDARTRATRPQGVGGRAANATAAEGEAAGVTAAHARPGRQGASSRPKTRMSRPARPPAVSPAGPRLPSSPHPSPPLPPPRPHHASPFPSAALFRDQRFSATARCPLSFFHGAERPSGQLFGGEEPRLLSGVDPPALPKQLGRVGADGTVATATGAPTRVGTTTTPDAIAGAAHPRDVRSPPATRFLHPNSRRPRRPRDAAVGGREGSSCPVVAPCFRLPAGASSHPADPDRERCGRACARFCAFPTTGNAMLASAPRRQRSLEHDRRRGPTRHGATSSAALPEVCVEAMQTAMKRDARL